MQTRTQRNERGGMNLRDARFANVQDGANLFHGEFLEVVEGQDLAFFLAEFVDSLGEHGAHFGAEGLLKRIVLGTGGQGDGGIFGVAVFGSALQAAEIEAAKFAEKVLHFDERKAEMGGEFGLGGSATELRGEIAASLAAKVAGAPIHLAEAIEDGAADAEAGVGF